MFTYYTATSLDGFLATDDDSVAFLEELPQPSEDTYSPFYASIDCLAMGRATYEFLLRHMEGGGAWPYDKPCYVFTHRDYPPRDGVTFVQGDVGQVDWQGDVWVVGGGGLAGQFYDAGLLDRLVVTVASRLLGSGKPLLPRDMRLERTGARELGSGFVELTFQVLPKK